MSELSKLAAAIEKRGRYNKVVDMGTVLGQTIANHDGCEITRVCFQVNTKHDDDEAVIMAYARVADLAIRGGAAKEEIKNDWDLINDNKLVQAMYRACRDPDNPQKPLFPSPTWMIEHLDTDVLAGLVNGYNLVKEERNGTPNLINDEFVKVLRNYSQLDSTETILTHLSRRVLEQALIYILRSWDIERTVITQYFEKCSLPEETLKQLQDLLE